MESTALKEIVDTKEIRFKLATAEHDLLNKMNRVRQMLSKGKNVKLVILEANSLVKGKEQLEKVIATYLKSHGKQSGPFSGTLNNLSVMIQPNAEFIKSLKPRIEKKLASRVEYLQASIPQELVSARKKLDSILGKPVQDPAKAAAAQPQPQPQPQPQFSSNSVLSKLLDESQSSFRRSGGLNQSKSPSP